MPVPTLEITSTVVTSVDSPTPAKAPSTRLDFLDNLKVFLTVLVVMHHAGQPYGPTGGRWPIMHAAKERMLGPFFHVDASFFMGLFFLISAYFVPAALGRKGPARFLGDRALRFGVPILLFGLLLYPWFGWRTTGHVQAFGSFWVNDLIVNGHFDFAHLWFLGHLLLYGLLCVAWRRYAKSPANSWVTPVTPRPFPTNRAITFYALALAAVDSVIRIWYPIDHWVFVGVPVEVAHLPQYISLFVLGILAYRYDWLRHLPESTGRLWLAIGTALAVLRLSYTATHQSFLRDGLAADLVWNLWEAFLCVGLCIGLLHLFATRINGRNAFSEFLSRNAFGVYIFHLPILVGFQFAMERTSFGPLALTFLTGTATVVVSYLLTAGLRVLPGAKRVL